jgi:hypothetical protein
MPDSEELGIAENTPMAALVKAMEAREAVHKTGEMMRSAADFLVPCRTGKRDEQGRCPEDKDDDNS